LGVTLLVLLTLARGLSVSPDARTWLLFVLHAAVLAILVFILIGPSKVLEVQQPGREPSAIFLIDSSRSMSLGTPVSRLDQVRQVIEEANRLLRPDRSLRIESYRFGDKLVALPDSKVPVAADSETHLASAVEQLPSRFGDGLPIGVVVFSDGRTTEPEALDETARGFLRLGVPIHVVPVGDPRTAGDVALEDLIAPRDPPSGARVPISVVVRSQGYADRRAEIHIRSRDKTAREPIAVLPIILSDGKQAHQLAIETDRAGAGDLLVEVPEVVG
jgi:hypothetical protein